MDIYKSEKGLISKLRKRKIDLIFLWLFVFCALVVVFAIAFSEGIRGLLSETGYNLYGNIVGVILIVGFILIIPCFILIKNIILKIIFGLLILFIGIPLIVYLFIMHPYRVKGSSMMPNLLNGDFILASYIPYRFESPRRGDVVVYNLSRKMDEEYVARIIGLPGEYISIKNGLVYINDKVLVEPYLSDGVTTEAGSKISNIKVLIPENKYAILGDNREHSFDSRGFGFFEKGLIKDKVFYIYWPSDRQGPLKTESPQVASGFQNSIGNTTKEPTCKTLGTKMIVGSDGKGEIGCDIQVTSDFNISSSYCESQTTHVRKNLIPDAYERTGRYYATLTGLNLNEEVKVFITSNSGTKIECLPSLNTP